MSAQTETLGGRLPLLDPSTLSTAQRETYERLNRTWIPWANSVPFQSKLDDGRLIGPFNPITLQPRHFFKLFGLAGNRAKKYVAEPTSPPSGDPYRRRRMEIELRALRSCGGGPKGRYLGERNPNADER